MSAQQDEAQRQSICDFLDARNKEVEDNWNKRVAIAYGISEEDAALYTAGCVAYARKPRSA